MSRTVDLQRAAESEVERNLRAERVLLELLVIVRARREKASAVVVAERIQRHRNTVSNRARTLIEMLELIERKGLRGPT